MAAGDAGPVTNRGGESAGSGPFSCRHRGRVLVARPRREPSGRWSVAVRITGPAGIPAREFHAEDGISYILEEEAASEALRLGRSLIERGMD